MELVDYLKEQKRDKCTSKKDLGVVDLCRSNICIEGDGCKVQREEEYAVYNV